MFTVIALIGLLSAVWIGFNFASLKQASTGVEMPRGLA